MCLLAALLRRLLRDDTEVVVQVVQGRSFTARDGIGRVGARERFLKNGRRKCGCNRLVFYDSDGPIGRNDPPG